MSPHFLAIVLVDNHQADQASGLLERRVVKEELIKLSDIQCPLLSPHPKYLD